MLHPTVSPRNSFAALLHPARAAQLGPVCADAIGRGLVPRLPAGAPVLLFSALAAQPKPWAFQSLETLARRIHRDRRGEALNLFDIDALFADDRLRRVTRIQAESVFGSTRLLGFAWLGGHGRDWRNLQAVLHAEDARARHSAQAQAA